MTSNPDDLKAVGEEGEQLLHSVQTLLDNPDYVFRDASGEEWARQLEAMAARCDDQGLGFLSRQLRGAASQVEARSEKW